MALAAGGARRSRAGVQVTLALLACLGVLTLGGGLVLTGAVRLGPASGVVGQAPGAAPPTQGSVSPNLKVRSC
jgi:hypothetical protein